MSNIENFNGIFNKDFQKCGEGGKGVIFQNARIVMKFWDMKDLVVLRSLIQKKSRIFLKIR